MSGKYVGTMERVGQAYVWSIADEWGWKITGVARVIERVDGTKCFEMDGALGETPAALCIDHDNQFGLDNGPDRSIKGEGAAAAGNSSAPSDQSTLCRGRGNG